jgi:hypothetical protein
MTNAYILWNYKCKARLELAKDKLYSGHWAIYELVVQALLVEPPEPTAGPTVKPRPTSRPTYKSLPQARLTRPIEVHKRIRKSKTYCFFCRYLEGQKKNAWEAQMTFNIPNLQGSYFTKYYCSHCNIALCINCFNQFHYYIVYLITTYEFSCLFSYLMVSLSPLSQPPGWLGSLHIPN